ncbi:ABC transporter ATP-binding protein [Geobacter sp. SVR]|uniref:ABC transporter ATP-binding protein n=1 Tax=Geobacter sp. SVR TaxID=2495594 RepID=UPI00143EF949|nr:ABC transporter ATP-binding protein [Geobacter sp. SVR]BCS53238.1 Fe3+/spermidine/putrescine ABC transporter ATP-binding protein [Geobacter sp. SVR]GCF84623.1 Fe3+/spermidine/putrescine ABC transporter ATP-binding protein [Geobacter sp. SVR]
MNAFLEARGLGKNYGTVAAVHGFSHCFAAGKITTLLGPSGSGKSTTLAMLAGLTDPDAGSVLLDGTDITRRPAEQRDFGLVFQNYSLFPHLSVLENVEFGLRVRGVGRRERRQRALAALEKVHMVHLAPRRIHQISGGEQQRTALARALAFNPRVLLLDEPLSALDAKLRESLRGELWRLLNELSLTAVYVTHDQVEAMSLGHELIIMQEGRIEQAGAPLDVYRHPASPFVADFLGSANLLAGECISAPEGPRLRFLTAELPAPAGSAAGPCAVMIRPEDILIVPEGSGQLRAQVTSSLFLGSRASLTVACDGCPLTVDAPNDSIPTVGETVSLHIRPDRLRALRPQTLNS